MPRTTLTLAKETLDELTSDDLSAVVGALGGSGSCSCTLANVCIGQGDDPQYELRTVVGRLHGGCGA